MGRDCLKLLALASMAGFVAGCAPDVPVTRYSLQVCGQEHSSEVRDQWWGSLYVAQLMGDSELVVGVPLAVPGEGGRPATLTAQFHLTTLEDQLRRAPEKLKGRYAIGPAQTGKARPGEGAAVLFREQPEDALRASAGELVIDSVEIVRREDDTAYGVMSGHYRFQARSDGNQSTCAIAGSFSNGTFKLVGDSS
ncbi:hypothetical protein QO207_12695 [Pseudomonas sp. CAN2814]|uniref:hypothetical protein n=1 Tax=Pseudomonas sp. CAN1 TaxID=3046726 RepID=UPI00264A09E6|nr:hypothetical protein [Pseudomonas sp. CAN1]MDN6857446.1 hypothetical protein [Pseudomonas sp. CAN1]